MAKNNLINLQAFDMEIGKIGFDENRNASFFQYNPEFLKDENYLNLFPLIIRKQSQTQVFDHYNAKTFRGLPPPIADSLPDMFGNLVFKAWLENNNKAFKQISILEQLAYIGKRGMGALEYLPSKDLPANTTINIDEMAEVARLVVERKNETNGEALDHTSLVNIFKIGTSAGGVGPKILVSENKKTGRIIPGDLEYSNDYDHYLVKLGIDAGLTYSKELIEYAYYLTAIDLGIQMMESKLIGGKYFATLRYDRQNGEKIHVLTACGMAGLDFEDPKVSSYENLFDLALYLKLPHQDIEAVFRRMVFNVIFANKDDHLKNHSFCFNKTENKWRLSPAYDITYSLNPLLNFTRAQQVLSINGKRIDITQDDLLVLAERYTVKNPKGVIKGIQEGIGVWVRYASELEIPENIVNAITKSLTRLV
jgi:serine/threonine-protein kinase HipA